jgi:hypothetical protein
LIRKGLADMLLEDNLICSKDAHKSGSYVAEFMEEDIDKLIYDNISEINYKIIYKKSHDD